MSAVTFDEVRPEHVLSAVARIRVEGVPARRESRSTRVRVDGVTWPAKYVLGLAWEIANHRPLDSEEFTGGWASGKVLVALGFDVEHDGVTHRGHIGTGRQPLVVASVAFTGDISTHAAENARRAALLEQLVEVASTAPDGAPVGTVVLPGGFFRHQRYLGRLNAQGRRAALDEAPFAPACRAAAKRLAGAVPGAALVIGVDGVEDGGEWADQMAVAWGPDGVLGVGRKVFPVAGAEAVGLVINADDFGDAGRVIALPGRRTGVLCSCYDAFGVSFPRERVKPIRRLRVGDAVLTRDAAGFVAALDRAVAAWTALITGVDAALIAVHGFVHSTSMWQRHGIATASAALGGGLVVGGAHFARLPRSAEAQTLSAFGVPRAHLDAGHHRGAASLIPSASVVRGEGMIRWFPWPAPPHAGLSG